jgi:uncharacterized coiled-coil protein SlyX
LIIKTPALSHSEFQICIDFCYQEIFVTAITKLQKLYDYLIECVQEQRITGSKLRAKMRKLMDLIKAQSRRKQLKNSPDPH